MSEFERFERAGHRASMSVSKYGSVYRGVSVLWGGGIGFEVTPGHEVAQTAVRRAGVAAPVRFGVRLFGGTA